MKNPCFKSSNNELTESKIKEAFDLLEAAALKSTFNPCISRTTFEGDQSLELNSSGRFLRFSFDSEQLGLIASDDVDAVIHLSYTGQDLRPIRGKVITERSFQGVVDKFYLSGGNWFILNPNEFQSLAESKEIQLTERLAIERIFFDVFEA
ncbi:MAG: hypothetical protein SFU25_08055 [Candidatus Caenarcaniphilales bacterium]|nr:hypothetical protein [Candidatus Caenarcaniphilales bacterium]